MAAGSPCPGFSVLQMYKDSEKSMKMCSHVCSVISSVDYLMPIHLVFENVQGVAKTPTAHPEHNVFSQMLCCLVAMGYQVQQFLMDPTGYGSCESRLRVFIVATAPGHRPPDQPPQTHSFPDGVKKTIGKASNGEPFATLTRDIAPLDFTTTEQALGDLPNIGDSHVQTCIQVPDHRVYRKENDENHNLIAMIPRWPHASGLVHAYHMGTLGDRQKQSFLRRNGVATMMSSKAWSRVRPKGTVNCLTTHCQPRCAFGGRVLHWEQHRVLTIMEARRIQSIPDDEVIIGIPTAQWKIIGNSVDRKVSFAIGLAIGRAWVQRKSADGKVVAKIDDTTGVDLTQGCVTLPSRRQVTIAQTSIVQFTEDIRGLTASPHAPPTGESDDAALVEPTASRATTAALWRTGNGSHGKSVNSDTKMREGEDSAITFAGLERRGDTDRGKRERHAESKTSVTKQSSSSINGQKSKGISQVSGSIRLALTDNEGHASYGSMEHNASPETVERTENPNDNAAQQSDDDDGSMSHCIVVDYPKLPTSHPPSSQQSDTSSRQGQTLKSYGSRAAVRPTTNESRFTRPESESQSQGQGQDQDLISSKKWSIRVQMSIASGGMTLREWK